jgi:archaellum component FlaC
VTCAAGHRIKLEEQGHGISDADRSLKKLEQSIKDLNRKLRF